MSRAKFTRKLSVESILFLWLASGGSTFLIISIQSIAGKYGGEYREIWSWSVSALVPNLALTITATLMDSHRTWRVHGASRIRFLLAFVISLIQIGITFMSLAIEPLVTLSWRQILDISDAPLAIVEGIR